MTRLRKGGYGQAIALYLNGERLNCPQSVNVEPPELMADRLTKYFGIYS